MIVSVQALVSQCPVSTVVADSITWVGPSQYRNKLVTPWLPSGSVCSFTTLSPLLSGISFNSYYDVKKNSENSELFILVVKASRVESLSPTQVRWLDAEKTRNIFENCEKLFG